MHFSPKEAIHQGEVLQTTNYLSEFGYDTLVIDYEVLALLPPIEEVLSGRDQQAPAEQQSPRDGELPVPPEKQAGATTKTKERSLRDQEKANVPNQKEEVTVEELKAQIDALKKELAEQRAVLERLKNSPQ